MLVQPLLFPAHIPNLLPLLTRLEHNENLTLGEFGSFHISRSVSNVGIF